MFGKNDRSLNIKKHNGPRLVIRPLIVIDHAWRIQRTLNCNRPHAHGAYNGWQGKTIAVLLQKYSKIGLSRNRSHVTKKIKCFEAPHQLM